MNLNARDLLTFAGFQSKTGTLGCWPCAAVVPYLSRLMDVRSVQPRIEKFERIGEKRNECNLLPAYGGNGGGPGGASFVRVVGAVMARVKEISVTYARTVNLGNFESMRIDFGEVVTLDADDDAEAVRSETFARVKKDVGKQIKVIKEKRGIK